MDIVFNTNRYTWTYGHSPKGRGSWWFSFEGYEFSHCGTYSEAKAACKKYIKSVAPANYNETVFVEVET